MRFITATKEAKTLTPVDLSKIFKTYPESIIHQASSIDEFCYIVSSSTFPSSNHFVLTTDVNIQWRRDCLELEFLDCNKINGILNVDLPLIRVVIIDRNLTGFLMDEGSSYRVFYFDMMALIGIKHVYHNSYGEGDLLAFNDSITHP